MEFALHSNRRRKNAINQLLEHRCPIHFGGLSDPLQPIDKKYRATYRALQILSSYDYPLVISTKGRLLGDPEYLELLESYNKCVIQVSFSTFDDNLGRNLEPGAPLPSERLAMIAEASKRRLWVAIRIQPFLFPVHDVGDYNLRSFAEAGAKHVIVEHLRIPTNFSKEALQKLYQVLGIDVLAYYREKGLKVSRVNYELRPEVKAPNIIKFRNLAHEAGMTFGCGDNDLHHYSDDDCCCGIQALDGFEQIYRGSFLTAVRSAQHTGEIQMNIVTKAWHPSGSIREFLNADCRHVGCSQPLDYLAYAWNHPKMNNSPASFYGVEYKQDGSTVSYSLTEECLKNIS